MLGSTRYDKEHYADEILKQVAHDMGVGQTYRHVDRIGVYLGDSDGDPYFNGLGPVRRPCIECAGCMVGCRHEAKNSLDKNYLWFAEKYFGASIIPEMKVFKIEQAADGSYVVHTRSATNIFLKNKVFHTKGIVLSAGVIGTLDLLFRQKFQYKTLINLSPTLGDQLLTNSEMISGATVLDQKLNHGVAISTMFNPDKHTFVELCKYPMVPVPCLDWQAL
ncbi:MAG: GMC family oxidoreductase N-terminal domain-containing protein [Saprospiraceae bacterium]|nr:GMC family oxidoreductase N-terminal domain-containing protein [Saprospiraceae bacterium]